MKHVLKKVCLGLLVSVSLIQACQIPNNTVNSNKFNNISNNSVDKKFNTKGLYDQFTTPTLVSVPVSYTTKVDYYVSYWALDGNSVFCKYDTKEDVSHFVQLFSFVYNNQENKWYVTNVLWGNRHVLPENGGPFSVNGYPDSGNGYSGSLTVSSQNVTIQIGGKDTSSREWTLGGYYDPEKRSLIDACRPDSTTYIYLNTDTIRTWEFSVRESFPFTPTPEPCLPDIYPNNSPDFGQLIDNGKLISDLLPNNGFKVQSNSNGIDYQMNLLNQKKEEIRNKINQIFGKEISKNENLENLSFEDFKSKISYEQEFFYYSLWRNSYDVVQSYQSIVNEINLYQQLWKEIKNNRFSKLESISEDDLFDDLEKIRKPSKLLKYLSKNIKDNLDLIDKTNNELKEDIRLANDNIVSFGAIESKANNFLSQIPTNVLTEMIAYYESQKSFSTKMAGQQIDPDGPVDGDHTMLGGISNPRPLAESLEKLIEKASSKIRNGIDDLWGNGTPKTQAGKDLANNVGKINEGKVQANTSKQANQKNLDESIKRTDHGQERTEQRPGPDQLKTIRDGDQYVQPDGKKVYVDGTHLVVTGRGGGVVTTRNDVTKVGIQKKVREGAWKPLDKKTGKPKQDNLNSIFDKIKKQKDCRTQ